MNKVVKICSWDEPEDKCRRVYLLANMEKEDILRIFLKSNISMVRLFIVLCCVS